MVGDDTDVTRLAGLSRTEKRALLKRLLAALLARSDLPRTGALADRRHATSEAVVRRHVPPLRPVSRDEPLPLSFSQEALWFLEQLQPGNPSYNCPAAVHIIGRLHREALRGAFEQIVHRHESLRSTFASTMLSALQTLLHRWSGQDDICVGSPIANRNRAETEGLIGFVVNTLVLRGDLTGNPTFVELMRRNREVALAAYDHQELPFERLTQALHPNRDVRHPSPFQVLFVLQSAPVHLPTLPGLTSPLLMDRHNGTAKFDLTLGLIDMPDGLVGRIEYNSDLFDRRSIERMASQFQRLLEEVIADPSRTLGDLPLLSADEPAALLAPARFRDRFSGPAGTRDPGHAARSHL